MTADEQLEWEGRAAPLAAAAAIGSALALLGGAVAQIALARERGNDNEADYLRVLNDHATGFLLTTALQVVGYLLLGYVLYYLFVATRARREQLPPVAIYLIYLAPVMIAAFTVITQLDRIDAAETFVTSGPETVKRAEDLLESPGGLALGLGLAGGLALGLSLVLVSLNALRAGLLTRFLGVIGTIIGALSVLPLAPGVSEIVRVFWLGALAALFLDRYPGGRGKAWETDTAERWPSRAELAREQVQQERLEAQQALEPGADPEPVPRPTSRKRKRKRR